MSSVDVSVPIENVSEIEPIIDTVPHFPTVTKKENTLGKTVSNSEHQLISSVDLSVPIQNVPEIEYIIDPNPLLTTVSKKENSLSEIQDQITVIPDFPLEDENAVFIMDKNIACDGPSQPIRNQYSPQKFGNDTFKRDFKPNWFEQYPWLSFSLDKKEVLCYACKKYSNNNSFIFTNWKKVDRLKKHALSEPHGFAMTKWMNSKIYEKKNSTILSQLDSQHKATVLKNRQYLKVIIETLMFTAQQNIAQRGHEENRLNITEISNSNRGNFLELLSLRCRDLPWFGNMLNEKLDNHTQWTSPNIQNELLSILTDFVRQRIVHDVQESGIFAVILDETSDISRIEQVSLCLSYIADGVKKETFIGFYKTKSTEGEVLYELLKKAIENLNLNTENIVGKCFDGAANMSGVHKG